MIILPETDPRRIAIESGDVTYTHLINLTIGETIYRITSSVKDITISGNTWRSVADLVGSSYPKHDSDYQRDFWELEFAEHATNEKSKDNVRIHLTNASKTSNRLTFIIPNDSTILPSHWFFRSSAETRIRIFRLDMNTNCFTVESPGSAVLREDIKLTFRMNGNIVTGTWSPISEACALDSITLAQAIFADANSGQDAELELELIHVPWHKRFSEAYATNSAIEVMYAFQDANGNFSNPLVVYKGVGGAVTTQVDRQNRFTTSIQFTGPLTRLDNDYTRTTTQASQQEVDVDDTSMNFAHENDTVLTWSA